MESLLSEFVKLAQKQSELDVKTKESFDALLAKFVSYDGNNYIK